MNKSGRVLSPSLTRIGLMNDKSNISEKHASKLGGSMINESYMSQKTQEMYKSTLKQSSSAYNVFMIYNFSLQTCS